MHRDDYRYDVFISYSRMDPTLKWVRDIFEPLLKSRLQAVADSPKIFIDSQIQTGALWNDTLVDALRSSRFLVPVFSPGYFRSPWCEAECRAFLARPHTPKKHQLIRPVKFSDGKSFSDYANAIQHSDFSKWNYTSNGFINSLDYYDLERAVDTFARDIADALEAEHYPPYNQDYRIEIPNDDPVPDPVPHLPRM